MCRFVVETDHIEVIQNAVEPVFEHGVPSGLTAERERFVLVRTASAGFTERE